MDTHEYKTTIEDRHLDLFGHINNAAYLELFEEARWDWITGNGFGRKEVLESGIGPTLLEVKLRFKREIRGKERVVIRSKTLEYRGKIGRVEQVMMTADGSVSCVAEFVIALLDLRERKLIRPTPEWAKAIGLSRTG
ncbi:MAG: acyl-CoA thioesterase [Elusimicrobia bacterium]|nr:acyl-CoA thioesterase [Elusimicrobiota bacterium]